MRLIDAYAPYLSQDFVDENFAFRGTVLSGAKESRRAGSAASRDRMRAGRSAWASCTCRSTSRPSARRAWKRWCRTCCWPTRSDRHARLDEPGNQEAGASQAGQVHGQDRLSEQVARLLGLLVVKRDDLVGNVMRARVFEPQQRSEQAGQADRPRRVGHDAADRQRLLQPGDERDRVPGRDPAAAVLRRERRRRGQLRRASAR
jgi:hypothetical protein